MVGERGAGLGWAGEKEEKGAVQGDEGEWPRSF